MLFSKTTGKLCGMIDADPVGDQHFVCVSYRPISIRFPFWDHWRYFVTPWSEIFDSCFVVCPD